MHSLAFWFQSPETLPAAILVGAAASLLALTAVIVVQLRRQVQAAWTETGRIYQRSSARFSAIGDLLDGILFETDATRTLTYTNQAFHALTGFRERDLRSGLTLNDLFEPDERQRLLEDLETAPDNCEVRVRSFHLRRRDGAAVPVSLRMAAITDQDRLLGWRGLVAPAPATDPAPEPCDVEQVLGGILREFNETPAAEHEAVLARGLAEIGRLLGADRCYHYHTSYDGESLLSMRQWYAPGVSAMSGDQRLPGLDQFPWSLARLRDIGALVVADVQDLDPAETPERGRWLRQGITSLIVVPLRWEREIVGLLGCETLGRVRHWGPRDRQLLETMAEICQRVQDDDQTARRLAQANERTGDLAELLPEPVAMTDADGRIVVWNPVLAKLSGLTAEQVCGEPGTGAIEAFLPGCGRWLDALQEAPPRGRDHPAASRIVEAPGPDGDGIWVQVSHRPLAAGAGCLLHFTDLTATKREESRMREAMAQQQAKLDLAQAQLEKIKTPVDLGLTAASDLASQAGDLAQAYQDGLMRRSSFEEFLTAARESSGLIGSNLQRAVDLLSGGRRTAAGQPRPVLFDDLLGGVFGELEPRLAERHVTVRIVCPADLAVLAETAALERVVTRLAVNALDHAFDGMLVGTLTVDVSRKDDQIVLRFADDGRGIGTAQRPGGAEVYSLVTRNLGGTIRCDSKTGKGTVFEIMFPATAQSVARSTTRSSAAEA